LIRSGSLRGSNLQRSKYIELSKLESIEREITDQLIQNNAGLSFINPIETHWRAHLKIDDDDYLSNRSLRIYAQPQVAPTYAEWILVKEGYVDEEGNIQWTLDSET